MKIKFHSEFGEEIENNEHKLWHEKHQSELQYAQENNICPSCGKLLGKDDVLYDRGFKCGIDCNWCS